MENFFQANGIWLAIVAFILGLILLIKAWIKESKTQEEEYWFTGSMAAIICFMFMLVASFTLIGLMEQEWKVFGILYLISLGLLFLGYVLYKIGKYKASAAARPDQEVKNSQKELKEQIKKEKKEMGIR